MRKTTTFILMIVVSVIFSSCTEQSPSASQGIIQTKSLTLSEKAITQSDNAFGLEVFQRINEAELNKNTFISPLSISMALGMTYNGANGETREAMANALKYNDLSISEVNKAYKSLLEKLSNVDEKVIFDIANSIWFRQEFLPNKDFSDLNQLYFNAISTPLDFTSQEALNTINNWVNDKTNGKIDKILNDIDPNAIMYLINAIYFKGDWTYEFSEKGTKEADFVLLDESFAKCMMMNQAGEFNYMDNEELQLVELPYGDGDYCMYVFLPKYPKDVNAIISELSNAKMNSLISGMSKKEGDLYFPKFKLEYKKKMNDILKDMGMSIAFDSQQADFTNMYSMGGVWISEVLHKTFIDVNEKGTEAAAVTSVEMNFESHDPNTFNMYVNKPFAFSIVEKNSGTILFIGKIMQPEYAD